MGQRLCFAADGNLLSDGMRSFTYDVANRLVQVVSGTITTTFAYNGDGRLHGRSHRRQA